MNSQRIIAGTDYAHAISSVDEAQQGFTQQAILRQEKNLV